MHDEDRMDLMHTRRPCHLHIVDNKSPIDPKSNEAFNENVHIRVKE